MSTPESGLQTPMLRPRQELQNSSLQSPLVSLLGRATGQRAPSMLVRETAARELEERRADWGYSTPVVFLDILWNVAFLVVSSAMLAATTSEKPNTPIRLWICGYSLQCLVHAFLVWIEYRKRNVRRPRDEERGDARRHESEDEEDSGSHEDGSSLSSSPSQRCESLNTMVSFIWWIIGFYWVISGGDELVEQAPRLYWLAVVFLAFDVFFAIFCVLLACLIGIALCCCLPCIIAILYAVAGQDGASEADLNALPKYQFQVANKEEKESVGAGKMVPIESTSRVLATERVLLEEDADCCICLTAYDDGAELHALPCNHHFHSSCIVKWLKMNATCPLCKFNILKGSDAM